MQVRYGGQLEKSGEKLLASLGSCRAIERFVNRYGKTSNRAGVLFHLARYLKRLRESKQ